MLARGICSGRELEVPIGHYTFCFLLSRPLLSAFRAVYVYMRRHYSARVRLWPCVRHELECASSLLTLVESGYTAPWHRSVYVSDSSLSGFAVHRCEWSEEAVRIPGGIS